MRYTNLRFTYLLTSPWALQNKGRKEGNTTADGYRDIAYWVPRSIFDLKY